MSTNLPELAKSAFEAEVARRSSLLGAVGFPTTILTALLAGLYASFSQLTLPPSRLELFAAFCGLVALGLVAISGFHLATSLVSHEYQYPANIRDIHLWYEQVLATGRDKAEADEQLDAYLTAEYVKCGAHNTARNDLRSYQLYQANVWMIRAVLAAGAAVVPFAALKIVDQQFATSKTPAINNTTYRRCDGHVRSKADRDPARGGSAAGSAAASDSPYPREC